jgi:putative PIN family toxin of toxin-antitoxin system
MRIVLDTNQLVAALVRPPELATFLMTWQSARFTVIASQAMIDEYLYVLNYPDIAALVSPELRRAFESHLLYDIEIVDPAEVPQICRDPDDDKVIATAIYGLADYLVTIDQDLLESNVVPVLHELRIHIIAGDQLVRLIDESNGD